MSERIFDRGMFGTRQCVLRYRLEGRVGLVRLIVFGPPPGPCEIGIDRGILLPGMMVSILRER